MYWHNCTVPFMKEESYGRIINIISTSVKEPIEGLGVSNTIRNAVGNWSKTLSFELGRFGITVNNVLPGFTETERLNEIIKIKADQGTDEYRRDDCDYENLYSCKTLCKTRRNCQCGCVFSKRCSQLYKRRKHPC